MERAENTLGRGARRWAVALFTTCALAAVPAVTGGAGASADAPVDTLPADTVPMDTAAENVQSLAPTVTLPVLVIGTTAAAGGTGAAGAGRPAQRLQQLGSIPFPMQAVPKCQVLDSFADARSGGRSHDGIDILATLGQPVYAVADGTLTKQYVDGVTSSLSGNGWKLSLPDRTFFFYAHLSGFPEGLTVGARVKRGDLIGFVGDTGNPGPGNYHLHFEYHPLGEPAIDPLPMLEIPSTCKVY